MAADNKQFYSIVMPFLRILEWLRDSGHEAPFSGENLNYPPKNDLKNIPDFMHLKSAIEWF